jgi:hypothetical protein
MSGHPTQPSDFRRIINELVDEFFQGVVDNLEPLQPIDRTYIITRLSYEMQRYSAGYDGQ